MALIIFFSKPLLMIPGNYLPLCCDEVKPVIGRCFRSLAEAEEFYRKYAAAVGFDPRCYGLKTVDGVSTWRYMVCNKQGSRYVPDMNKGDALEDIENRRKRVSSRCGCMARISFKFDSIMGYVIHDFVEEHNHPFVEMKYKKFMKVNRNLDEVHKKFVLDCAKVSIGPTHAHKLLAELLSGVDNVGCTVADVRKFSREMKLFVDGSDAQMLLNEMKRKKEICDGFMYTYENDDEHRLKRVFWCDPVARRNYHLFGDAIAFDTTYSTNKYCMIFAPFTGKDNHGKPVTFAASLLSKEDADSFSWLFRNFVECMGALPNLIITDQDLGMRVAVERELCGTRHRWCMWHIMLKLADKVSKELHADESFKKELNSCVWSNMIEPDAFEDMWLSIMERYGLQGDPWFVTMFEIRRFWVPAYFRDHPMGGLLRTTSISESENNFFKRYTTSSANLMEFWMQYNHTLDAQRHVSDRLNYMDSNSTPTLMTKLNIEKHAGLMYTLNAFGQVQQEILAACFDCSLLEMRVLGSCEEYVIRDVSDKDNVVVHDTGMDTYVCGCKMFGRIGMLCCHILLTLKNKRISVILDAYLNGRWLKSSCAKPVHGIECAGVGGFVAIDQCKKASNDLMHSFFSWHQRFEGNADKLKAFMSSMDAAGKSISGDEIIAVDERNKITFEKFYGGTVPAEVDVLPPRSVKTKGSGSRLISRKEKAMREFNKPLRRCAKCKQLARHDARNCDKFNTGTSEKE